MKVCSFVEKSAKHKDDSPSWFTSKFLPLNLASYPLWILDTGLRARTARLVLMYLELLNIFSVFHPLCRTVVPAQVLYGSICGWAGPSSEEVRITGVCWGQVWILDN